eukprot:6322485-Pyramimonas_sp.AAC.1
MSGGMMCCFFSCRELACGGGTAQGVQRFSAMLLGMLGCFVLSAIIPAPPVMWRGSPTLRRRSPRGTCTC